MSLKLQIGFIFIIMYLSLNHLFYPDLIFQLTNSGHWEVVLCQGLLQLFLIWIYIKGLSYFPQQDVIDIYLKMGKPVAFILLIPFVIFLTAIVALNNRLHTEVIISIFLSRTPSWPVLVLLIFVTTYIALSGLGTILRSSFFIFFLIIPMIVLVYFTSFINTDWYNASPVWHPSLDFLINKKFFYLMGFSAFLPLGFMAYKTKLTFGSIFLAWVCVMFFFLSSVYIPLLIFGQESAITLTFSMVRAIYTVDLNWFFLNKQSMFLGLSQIGFTIILNAVLLWIIGRIMHKMLRWKKAKASYWIIAFSVVAFICALLVPSLSWLEKSFLWSGGANVYFMIIIPFSTYIYSFVMKRGTACDEKG
ncbi:GerAB/ArcD/ProY family transporter [Neobacillus sp. NRS-1170]|uniref:GerAB/ArcD/ProY family transporter n=1 Tax=Neobacillus sp. NRS-1170 TaxID=3233898 RepID=UPI003D2B12DC